MSNPLQIIKSFIGKHKQRILIAVFAIVIVMVPLTSLAIVQYKKSNSPDNPTRLFNLGPVTQAPKATSSKPDALTQLQQESGKAAGSNGAVVASDSGGLSTAVSFGPTLTFKVLIEGHPATNQTSKKFFVGIAAGAPSSKPTYLLSFTVDIPESGLFDSISLAGLDSGSQYTAYLKGSSQISTSSAFIMNPGVSTLNEGSALTLLSGDLNDDNVINAADYSLGKAAFGSRTGLEKWSERADLNIDGVVNALDLGLIIRNFGKSGMGGAWFSPVPPSTQSATPSGSVGGFWMWVPR